MNFMYFHRDIYLEHYYWQNSFDLDSLELELSFSIQLALVHLQLAYKARQWETLLLLRLPGKTGSTVRISPDSTSHEMADIWGLGWQRFATPISGCRLHLADQWQSRELPRKGTLIPTSGSGNTWWRLARIRCILNITCNLETSRFVVVLEQIQCGLWNTTTFSFTDHFLRRLWCVELDAELKRNMAIYILRRKNSYKLFWRFYTV